MLYENSKMDTNVKRQLAKNVEFWTLLSQRKHDIFERCDHNVDHGLL